MLETNGQRRRLVKSARKKLARFPEVDPSDVVQETALDLYRNPKRPASNDTEGLGRFLNRILLCNVVDAVRRASFRRSPRPLDNHRPILLGEDSASPQPADDATSPSGKIAKEEMSEQLQRAIADLPPKQRDVIRLRFFENRTLRETAEHLGMSERAAAGLLYRGVTRLRDKLATDDQ